MGRHRYALPPRPTSVPPHCAPVHVHCAPMHAGRPAPPPRNPSLETAHRSNIAASLIAGSVTNLSAERGRTVRGGVQRGAFRSNVIIMATFIIGTARSPGCTAPALGHRAALDGARLGCCRLRARALPAPGSLARRARAGLVARRFVRRVRLSEAGLGVGRGCGPWTELPTGTADAFARLSPRGLARRAPKLLARFRTV